MRIRARETRPPVRGASSSPGRRSRALLHLLVAAALAACATAPPASEAPPPTERGERVEDRPTEPVADARRVSEARDLLDRGRAEAAYRLADSLYFHLAAAGFPDAAERALSLSATARVAAGDTLRASEIFAEYLERFPRGRRSAETTRRLADLRLALGDDPGAASAILRGGAEDSGPVRATLREAARHLSIAELEAAIADAGSGAARWAVELLRSELDRAREEAASEGTVRVGVLLPSTGRLETVGRWLGEGISLARASAPQGAPEIELLPVDLAAGSDVSSQVERLFERGAVAVVGPVNAEQLAEAGRAAGRRLVVSPTATSSPGRGRPAYALWDRGRRETDAAAAIGAWLASAVRPTGSAVLYPATRPGRDAYLAFLRGLAGAGGGVTAAARFDPRATTVEDPIRAIAAYGSDVVFVPGAGDGSLLQLAPQLAYYGLRGVVVAGGPEWSEPATVRRMEPSFTQYRLVATYRYRSEGGGWADFTDQYEREHRRTLGANVLPGLGHDAVLLLTEALAEARPARPRAVARSFAALRGVEGATGRLSPDGTTGTVARDVEIRTLAERELVPTSPDEVRRWLEEASGLTSTQSRRRRADALRAVREAQIRSEGESGGGGTP